MAVRQLKGLVHCRLIKRRAKRIWKKTNLERGLWDQCLKTAIENHRREVEAEVISKNVQMQLAFTATLYSEGVNDL